MTQRSRGGFTLAEVVLGGMALSVAIAAILGAYIGQLTLNEHARNLSLAVQDANRVIEQIRQQNSSPAVCTTPSATAPGGGSWDAWLQGAGGGKSLLPDPTNQERIVVTCQNRDGTQYCPTTQMNPTPTGEWHVAGSAGDQNPLRVTAAVCWRHRNRTIGECTWNSATLAAADGAVSGPFTIAGVVESPAMLTTLVTCR